MKSKIITFITLLTLLITAILPIDAVGVTIDDVLNSENESISKLLNRNEYHDVGADDWYVYPVMRANSREIMWGIGGGAFSPNSVLTREMALAVLHRLEFGGYGAYLSENSGSNVNIPFDDVQSGAWYTKYVIWAADNGIVMGIGQNKFGVGNEISREELTTIIDRYLTTKNLGLIEKIAESPKFNDIATVSDWAADSLEILYKGGVIEGDDEGNFRPKDSITRAEAAAVFVRLDNAFDFDMTPHILSFDDDEVGSIVFKHHGFDCRISNELTVSDPTEIKSILTDLREIEISFSMSTASVVGGGKYYITVYDVNGEQLLDMGFTSSVIGSNGGRYYYFSDSYLQEYCDMLDGLID